MSFMQLKKYRFTFSIIAIIILLSGFCFENARTEPDYLSTPVKTHNLSINIINTNNSDTSICTSEMLGFYTPAYHHIENRQSLRNTKKEMISDFISTFLLSINGTRFKTKYELVPFIKTSNKELVINYIHNTDGKKRIF